VRRPGLTTVETRLSGPEWATTAVALGSSTAGFLRGGHRYLAQGVVGDLAGLGVAAAALAGAGRRLRHEAALCGVAILVVRRLDPRWPEAWPAAAWWAAIAAGLGAYLPWRNHRLAGAPVRQRAPAPQA